MILYNLSYNYCNYVLCKSGPWAISLISLARPITLDLVTKIISAGIVQRASLLHYDIKMQVNTASQSWLTIHELNMQRPCQLSQWHVYIASMRVLQYTHWENEINFITATIASQTRPVSFEAKVLGHCKITLCKILLLVTILPFSSAARSVASEWLEP